MARVTIESLESRITALEGRERSINEDFQLEAYRELLRFKVGYKKFPYVVHDFEPDEESIE
ncbi:hypothetical protein Eta_0029 [Serratia phage Eta]|uniref:Uncharacterized protein n=1 Tax=Serratia phage Eta TaxID=1282995 RepID=R9VYJ3_9CAUD|nr:hypothetical protein Eta_0029 [Serratia phage Eta]AGN89475.1 hypothetical protein Eta_0029 [Serratia phage Eta]